jgi:S1-C subfamily serine protease
MSGPRSPGRRHPIGGCAVAAVLVLGGCAGAEKGAATDASRDTTAVIPEDHGLTAERVSAILPSTVAVNGVACGRLARGSGFAVTENLVVTNAHVIVGIDDIRVHTQDGHTLEARAVAFDPDADLAILEVEGAVLEPLALATDAQEGTTGVLVGWTPELEPAPSPFRVERAVTVRIESVGGTERVERRSWLLAAEIEVGDSGAALVDVDGEVIGVAFATSTEGTDTGYAVRASEVSTLLAEGIDPNLTVPGC